MCITSKNGCSYLRHVRGHVVDVKWSGAYGIVLAYECVSQLLCTSYRRIHTSTYCSLSLPLFGQRKHHTSRFAHPLTSTSGPHPSPDQHPIIPCHIRVQPHPSVFFLPYSPVGSRHLFVSIFHLV